MAPQIIVIPQNLLQQNQAQSKSLLRISPQPKQFRVIASSPSQSLQSSRTIMSSPVTRPVATVVGCKRPAPPVSPEFDIKEIKEEEEEDEFTPVRKRANLDHLSPEERLMRRKLKNRVAAQNARDKKKAQCEEMEKMINKMKEEQQKLIEENSRLQEFNSKLQLDNVSLQEENTELKQRLGINPVNPQLTVELPLSPLSTPPSSPPSLSSSPRAVSPSTETASGWPQPSESSEGPGLQAGSTPVTRVVVERLDSLGAGVFGDSVVCGAAHLSPFSPPDHLTAQEEEQSLDGLELYVSNVSAPAGVSKPLRLNTDINTDLDNLLETPTTETMLDNILAETDYIDGKWAQHLDDLFPELD